MASVTLNPVFTGISGKMGQLVHVRRHNKQYVRTRVIPCNPRTECQMMNRMMFKDAVRAWQSLSSQEKDVYRIRAEKTNRSGYNLFISLSMKNSGMGISQTPPCMTFSSGSFCSGNSPVTAPFSSRGGEDLRPTGPLSSARRIT